MATVIKGTSSHRIIRLGEELRALRQEEGSRQTLGDVVAGLKALHPQSPWDQTKISKIERAILLIDADELEELLDFYGVEGEDRDTLTNLRTELPTKRWWREYEGVVTPAFAEYLALESEAAGTIEYAAGCTFPGLFQTEGYAALAIETGFDRPGGEQIEGAVAVRTLRQRRLVESPLLRHAAYFSEFALMLDDARQILDQQIRRAIDLSRLDNVTLRMVPVHVGRPGMLTSGLVLMHFADPTSRKYVFVEAVGGMLSRGSGQEVRRAESVFARLDQLALSPQKTIEALNQKLEAIS